MMSYTAQKQTINCPSGQQISVSPETILPSQNMMNFIPLTVPTEFFMYEPKGNSLMPLDPRTINFDPTTGLVIAPRGYTAIYTSAPQLTQSTTVCTSSSTEAVGTGSPIERSRQVTPEPVQPRRIQHSMENTSKPKRKFPHRSKQIRIKEVHDEVAAFFNAKDLYAFSETEVLRGEDTCRVHVKTYQGLNKILDVLKEVYEHPKVELKRIATPISMKNRYQQKGFIVYMKLASTKQVPIVQTIFEAYKDLYKKCDVAKPKTDLSASKAIVKPTYTKSTMSKSAVITGKSEVNKVITFSNISSMMPKAMAKQASHGA